MGTHAVRQVPLKPGVQALPLPRGATVLSVANLNGSPTLFVLVDVEEKRLAIRQVAVLRSGDAAPPDGRFVGTLLIRGRIEGSPGMAVHVFEAPAAAGVVAEEAAPAPSAEVPS